MAVRQSSTPPEWIYIPDLGLLLPVHGGPIIDVGPPPVWWTDPILN